MLKKWYRTYNKWYRTYSVHRELVIWQHLWLESCHIMEYPMTSKRKHWVAGICLEKKLRNIPHQEKMELTWRKRHICASHTAHSYRIWAWDLKCEFSANDINIHYVMLFWSRFLLCVWVCFEGLCFILPFFTFSLSLFQTLISSLISQQEYFMWNIS